MGWLDRQLPPESSSQAIVRLTRHMPTRCEGRVVDDAGLLAEKRSSGDPEGEPMLRQPTCGLVPEGTSGRVGRSGPDVGEYHCIDSVVSGPRDSVLSELAFDLGQLDLALLLLTGNNAHGETALGRPARRLLERAGLGLGLLDLSRQRLELPAS